MKYLIIGNGPAGVEAGIAIKKADGNSEVEIISSSAHLYYYRPGLVEQLSSPESDAEKLVLFKQDYYEKLGIRHILNNHVESVDVQSQAVYTSGGNLLKYDKLLLATGGIPFKPQIEGLNANGVFTLRTIADCEKIRNFINEKMNVVVIGAGLLGLEIAYNISSISGNVTVIESAEWLLPKQLDKNGAQILEDYLKDQKMNIVKNDTVKLIKNSSGKVSSLVTSKNMEISCDCIILAVGIKSNIHPGAGSGIKTDRGFLVDEYFRTNIDNVYSAGDAAQFGSNSYGFWNMARKQGMLAGRNMAGISSSYIPSKQNTVLKIAGIDLFSAGTLTDDSSKSLIVSDKSIYKRLDINDGKIYGIAVIGDKETAKVSLKAIDGTVKQEELIPYFMK